jgi:hypothetical protein
MVDFMWDGLKMSCGISASDSANLWVDRNWVGNHPSMSRCKTWDRGIINILIQWEKVVWQIWCPHVQPRWQLAITRNRETTSINQPHASHLERPKVVENNLRPEGLLSDSDNSIVSKLHEQQNKILDLNRCS